MGVGVVDFTGNFWHSGQSGSSAQGHPSKGGRDKPGATKHSGA